MKVVQEIVDASLQIVDRAGQGKDYADIQKEIERKANFVNVVLQMLLYFTAVAVVAIGILVGIVINRPSKSDHEKLSVQLNEAQQFIRDMVPVSEREKMKSQQIKQQAVEVKQNADEIVERIEEVKPVVDTYNKSYTQKIQPNAK